MRGTDRSDPGDTRTAGAVRRLLPWLKPYRGKITFALAISVASQIAMVTSPQVVKWFVDDALRAGRRDLVLPYALLAFGLGFTQALCWFLRRNSLGAASLGVEFDLRNALYRHLQRLHVGFHDGIQSGQLVSRAISDISRIRRFLGFGMPWLGLYAVLFTGVIVLMFRTDVVLACLSVAFSAPVGFVSFKFQRRVRKLSRQAQNEAGDLASIVEESATGVRVIKAYGRMPQRSAMFRAQAEQLLGTTVASIFVRSAYWTFSAAFLSSGLVAIMLVGSSRVVSGQLTLGALIAFISYQTMLAWPIRDVGWILAGAQEAFAASDRVYEILDTEPEIVDLPGARDLASTHGHLRFHDVTFAYPGTAARVLRHLDLEVRAGETVAIVGMTGCGKTSVAGLAARFYDPTSGRITLDGHDLRDLKVDAVRSHIGFAFEDPILFSASVRENLLMGAPDASDEQLWEALEQVQAADFVRTLPWGLDTRVGEQGYSLSGGQRQRLALARAVAGRPAILVLDDPLSSVDVHTEAAIEASLRGILSGRTAILIAHRPSTVALADRVALLHDGSVVATGTHHDLLQGVPLYREVLAKDVDDEMEEALA